MKEKQNKGFYLTTGKRGFNSLFYGKGIKVDVLEGTSILIEGAAGVGKTTLAIELVINAIKNWEARCIYYIFDQTRREITTLIENFRWEKDLDIGGIEWGGGSTSLEFQKPFTIVEARGLDIGVQKQLNAIKKHVEWLEVEGNKKIIVIDSVGANSELANLDRANVSLFLDELKNLNTIVILIREKDKHSKIPQSEYLTTVALDIQVEEAAIQSKFGRGEHTTTIEIKKTRNQASFRGPHECEIIRHNEFKPSQSIGFIVYPTLSSIAKFHDIKSHKQNLKNNALFGLDLLDMEIGIEEYSNSLSKNSKGIPYGQSILLKGPPGNKKTELSIKFLLEKKKSEKVLFISCRIDKEAIKSLDLFKGENPKYKYENFLNNLIFIDVRDPYKTPSMILSKIRGAIEENKKHKIHRVVLFGIGMLETFPLFSGKALHFLQVLHSYFKSKQICSIWVDWNLSQELGSDQGKLLQTEFARHLVAAAISVESAEVNKSQRTLLKITRKNYRSFISDVGYLEVKDNDLWINPINK